MPRKRRYLDETEVSKEANQVIKDKFTVNGVTYGTIPSHYTKGKIANSKTKSDITSDRVYVRQGDDGKWYQTRMDKDGNNINYYLDNKALIDRSNEIIESQSKQGIGHKIEVDKADARARQQWFSNEDATKFLLTTAGLGTLGGGFISAPLATTLGLVGGYAGGKAVDAGMRLGTGKTWGEWMSDKTGLPEWVTEFTNPGTVVGGIGGIRGAGYKLNTSLRTPIKNTNFKNLTMPYSVYYDMLKRASPYTWINHERRLINAVNKGQRKILNYLGSNKHVSQIMKSGIDRNTARAISNEMKNNIIDLSINYEDLGPNIGGMYRNSFNPNLGTIGNKQIIINAYGNPDLVPYDIIHEFGHGSTLGYSPRNNGALLYSNEYNAAMKHDFPHFEQVYKHNSRLQPERKEMYKNVDYSTKPEDIETAEHIKYLEDVDEYSTRARTKLIDNAADDADELYKYFTKKSVDNLLKNVWSISPYILGGTSLYKLNKRKNNTN